LKLLATYFSRHKGHENKELAVTAARARSLHAALLAARTLVDKHPDRQKAALEVRDEAIEQLRKRLRATLGELDMNLKGIPRNRPLSA